jgi:predicted Rossmann-fold nucleotide-binding protein
MTMADVSKAAPVIGVFASDKGPGDPERASMMSQAGTLLARRGAHLVCLWEKGTGPLPLMTAAVTAGGSVSIIADSQEGLPATLSSVPVTVIAEEDARHALLAREARVLVALPGSLASVSALFRTWSSPEGRQVPVVMLNRHRAYEAVRGFVGDVLSHSVSGYDRNVQFADTVEDLWNKVSWVLEQKR